MSFPGSNGTIEWIVLDIKTVLSLFFPVIDRKIVGWVSPVLFGDLSEKSWEWNFECNLTKKFFW